MSSISRDGVQRTIQDCLCKFGEGQNIALHVVPAARNTAFRVFAFLLLPVLIKQNDVYRDRWTTLLRVIWL